MANSYSAEDHERSRRRRRRQLLGAVICILILIGIINVVTGIFKSVAALFDDTEKKLEYEQKLQPLVMMDPLPFESLDQMDVNQLREYSIWASVAAAQRAPGGLDAYQRDPDTQGVLMPGLEVEAQLVSLLGPGYNDLLSEPIVNSSFETDIVYPYLEEQKAYIIPVTGQVGLYRAQVTNLQRKDGKLRVTVGYVPTAMMLGDYNPNTSAEPSKYMDYIFEKVDREYYLRKLEASETKPSSSAPVVDPELDTDMEFNNPMSAIADEVAMDDSSSEEQPQEEPATE